MSDLELDDIVYDDSLVFSDPILDQEVDEIINAQEELSYAESSEGMAADLVAGREVPVDEAEMEDEDEEDLIKAVAMLDQEVDGYDGPLDTDMDMIPGEDEIDELIDSCDGDGDEDDQIDPEILEMLEDE